MTATIITLMRYMLTKKVAHSCDFSLTNRKAEFRVHIIIITDKTLSPCTHIYYFNLLIILLLRSLDSSLDRATCLAYFHLGLRLMDMFFTHKNH